MNFTCPYCGKTCDFMEIKMDEDLHAIIQLTPAFGKHANLALAYCHLFGVTPLKLRSKKLRILLEELKMLFDAEYFYYQKTRYLISQAGIAEALNIVVHRHWTDHLESHNYLKKIMIGISEREGKAAGRETEKALRKKEAALQAGDRGQGAGAGEIHPTDEQFEANKRRLRELTDKIGD